MNKISRKVPPQPYPHVRTIEGEIVFKWNDLSREWETVYKPQPWLQKLLRLDPEPAIKQRPTILGCPVEVDNDMPADEIHIKAGGHTVKIKVTP